MKIAFMGSPEFALPSLKKLVELKYELALVICQPDKKQGRGHKTAACPVASWAREQGLELYQPSSLRKEENSALELLAQKEIEVIFCIAFGQIIPESILNFPKKGAFNAHASLLPYWRGAAPIHWGLLLDDWGGISLQKMEKALDTGPLFWQHKIYWPPQTQFEQAYQHLQKYH